MRLTERPTILENKIRLGDREPVIYFLIQEEEIVYVGETTNLFARLGHHMARGIEFDSYFFIKSSTDVLIRRRIERSYIRKFEPRHNISGLEDRVNDIWLRFHRNNHKGKFVGCLECKQARKEMDKKRPYEGKILSSDLTTTESTT